MLLSTNLPLVTIITPSFNQAQFISATIESVLSQDYSHLQYLVIDGGSTDGTLNVLRACTDPRLNWISEPDRGQTHALNKGLQQANGEIIGYLNSDDLFLPGALRTTVEAFVQHPEADMVYGDCTHIDAVGNVLDTSQGQPFDLAQVLSGRVYVPQQTAFWRRRVTEAIGLFDESLHYIMDVEYWLRLARAGFKPLYVPGVRAAYRLHQNSKTISQVGGFWREWDIVREQFFGDPALPPSITRLREKTLKTYWWMFTVQAPWLQGYRAELRPYLRQILTGAVPFQHRILAGAMLTDTYLNTPFTVLLQTIYQRVRQARSLGVHNSSQTSSSKL